MIIDQWTTMIFDLCKAAYIKGKTGSDNYGMNPFSQDRLKKVFFVSDGRGMGGGGEGGIGLYICLIDSVYFTEIIAPPKVKWKKGPPRGMWIDSRFPPKTHTHRHHHRHRAGRGSIWTKTFWRTFTSSRNPEFRPGTPAGIGIQTTLNPERYPRGIGIPRVPDPSGNPW